MKALIGVAGKRQRRQAGLGDLDADFLAQFADQSLLRPLAGIELAAGEFPKAGQRLALRALRDQHALVGVDQSAGDDEREFDLSHARSLRAAKNSRAVIAVDRDIFLGEVAGQHAVAALAEPKRNLDLDSRVLHHFGYLSLVVGRIARATFGDADAVER